MKKSGQSFVTERKRVDEELRESEAKYSALMEQAKDVVVIVQDGFVKFANSAVKEVTGFEVEEILGKPFLNWLTPESRDLVAERYKLRMAGEEVPPIYEAKIQCKDGAIKDIEISAGVIQYKGRPADLAIARDVSERKKMEEEIRGLARFPLENPNPILRLSKDGVVLDANPAGKPLLEDWGCKLGGEAPKFWRDLVTEALVSESDRSIDFEIGDRVYAFFVKPVKDAGYVNLYGGDITDRKHAEEEARKLTQFLNLVVDNANVWLDVLDEKANVLIWNKAAEKISGYSREEVAGHGKIWEWLYPDENYRREVFDSAVLIIKGAAADQEAETKIRTKSGEYKIISWYGRNLVDEKGAPIGSVALGRDITERKRVEEALANERNTLRTLIDNLPDNIFIKDAESRFVISNLAHAHLLRAKTPDEIVGKTDFDIFPPELAASYYADEQAVIRSGQPLLNREERTIDPDGKTQWLLTTKVPLRDDHGKVIGLAGINRNITERKQVEEALRESEEKYRALVENSPDLIGIVQDGYLKYVNRTLCERSGWTFEEVTCPSFNFIEKMISKKSRDLVKKNIENRLRGEAIPPYEITLLTRDGAEIPVIVNAQKILYQGKLADEFSLVDIAERKRMEAELEKHTKHLEELVEERARELRATRDRLQFLLSSSPAMIYTSKPYGDLGSTFISDNLKDVLGYEPRELIENPSFWIDHVHPKDRGRMREEELRVIGDGHGSYEYRFQHKDGPFRWMREEARLVRDAAGNPLEVIGYWIDVTDRKQMEEEIKALNESIAQRLLQKMSQIDNISEVKDRLRKIPDLSTGPDLILDTALDDLDVDVGAVLIVDRKDNTVKTQTFKSKKEGIEIAESYPLDKGFAELEAVKRNEKLSRIVGQGEQSILKTTSIHCAPIYFGKEMYGILAFGSQKDLVLDNSDLAILGLYSELASTLFETQSLTITPVKEVARVAKRRFELEFGYSYLIKNDVEKAFQVFADHVLSGLEGVCITREFPPNVRRKYGLETTPIVWLAEEREEGQTTVDSLQDLSILIQRFLENAKRRVVLLDGFEYLITRTGFESFIGFLQLNKSRFEKSESILIAPILEEALDLREAKLIEREMKRLTAE